jgi:hypothetical protein
LGYSVRKLGYIDTYVPGTLPERLYKRAQLEVDADDTYGCYRLTTQDAPITADEIEAIRVVEEGGQAIDQAIETIKKTIRPSRNRVVTNRAMESREQGTLGIASLFDV